MNSSRPPAYTAGFSSLLDEFSGIALRAEGTVSPALRGTLYRIGPGRFGAEAALARHWLDGFPMLTAIRFCSDGLQFSNQYVATGTYTQALMSQRGPAWTRHTPGHCLGFSVVLTNGGLEVLDGSGQGTIVDPATLATVGTASRPPVRSCYAASPHPVTDSTTGERVDLFLCKGDEAGYVARATDSSGTSRRLSSVPCAHPAWMHSFSMTPHWMVLVEGPFTVRATSFRSKRRPELRDYTWDASRGTRILLVNRATGELVRVMNTRPLFVLHHINAWEDRDSVFVDLAAFGDPAILGSLSLGQDGLPQGPFPAPQPTRLAIDTARGDVVCAPLKCPAGDFSAIDPRRFMSQHTVLYNVVPRKPGEPCMTLCRSKPSSGARLEWYSDNCYQGAPVFVPASRTSEEGIGWLLDVVLDATARRSFLLILDAATMTEQARAWLPCNLPFGSHALFIPEEATP